jgi:hypothetical protein
MAEGSQIPGLDNKRDLKEFQQDLTPIKPVQNT